MAAQHEAGDVADRHAEFPGEEGGEARRIEHAGHADDLVVGQARKFAQRPHHRVERIGDADDEGVGSILLDALAHRLHDLEVDAQQVIAAHARLARDAGGDDDDVRAFDVLVIIGARDDSVETFDRPALRQVQRLALRNALGDVEEDDVAQFLLRRQMGERTADIASADQRYLLTGHMLVILQVMIAGIAGSPTPFTRGFQPRKTADDKLSLQLVRNCIRRSHTACCSSAPTLAASLPCRATLPGAFLLGGARPVFLQ